jgi:hypothetical protein
MSFGSVIIPINGFGWVPFLEIMDFMKEFKQNFPQIEIKQDCMNVAAWNNPEVCKYIWRKSIDMDLTSKIFRQNQNGHFSDILCHHRYSIGAILFSHKVWEKMGGWKLPENFNRKYRINNLLHEIIKIIFGNKKKNRLEFLADYLCGLKTSELGVEEQRIFDFYKRRRINYSYYN